MKTLAVIPARYASTRFPGKPLALICGKPMIYHVYQRAKECKFVNAVMVATDNIDIYEAVEKFGGWAVLTSPECQSGTDRIAEAVHHLDYEIIANIQGDEPLLDSRTADGAIKCLLDDRTAAVSTAYIKITNEQDYKSPNIVKVVRDKDNFALYFSRSPIPSLVRADKADSNDFWGYKHLGLYVYKRDALLEFTKLKPSFLERVEKLEQLRFLENGYKIKLIEAFKDSAGVDIPEDIARVEKMMAEQNQ